MHIPAYSMGTKATRRKAAVHYAVHTLSRGNLTNLMPRSFTFVCQLYCCSSKHNNNKALRITFNSRKTASTFSMALATVNIDKIISDVSVILCINRVPSLDRGRACAILQNKLLTVKTRVSTLRSDLRGNDPEAPFFCENSKQ